MKRRDFLVRSAGLAGALLPVVGRADNRPCPPGTLGVSGGTSVNTTCAVGSAEQDWVGRSTGPGVVWAHDFRNAAEFTNFHERSYGFSSGPNFQYDPNKPGGLESSGSVGLSTMRHVADDGILGTLGGSIEAAVPYGFNGYPVGTSADAGGANGSGCPVWLPNGTSENWTGDRIKAELRTALGSWNRPFSGLSTGSNGLPTDDLGVQRGLVKARAWDLKNRSTYGNFKGGFYGHRDYWGTSGSTAADWDGSEFYVQIRIKLSRGRHGYMDGSTVPAIATQSPYPGRVYAAGGKLLWIVDNKGNDAEWITVSGGNQGQRGDVQNVGTPFETYTNRPAESITYPFLGPTGYTNGQTQGGGDYAACDIDKNRGACWRWPENEWVTLLYWMKPGHQSGGWQSDNMRYPQDSYFRIWVAREGQTRYQDLFKLPDGKGRWWRWQDSSYGTPVGQFQFLLLNAYMNNVPSVVPFWHRYTQIIFSQQFIPCPQA